MSSTIQVRVDDDLKVKSDNSFKELGTDTSEAGDFVTDMRTKYGI